MFKGEELFDFCARVPDSPSPLHTQPLRGNGHRYCNNLFSYLSRYVYVYLSIFLSVFIPLCHVKNWRRLTLKYVYVCCMFRTRGYWLILEYVSCYLAVIFRIRRYWFWSMLAVSKLSFLGLEETDYEVCCYLAVMFRTRGDWFWSMLLLSCHV